MADSGECSVGTQETRWAFPTDAGRLPGGGAPWSFRVANDADAPLGDRVTVAVAVVSLPVLPGRSGSGPT